MRSGLTTVPLQSRPNASPFWIMLLLSSTAFEHGMIDADRTPGSDVSEFESYMASQPVRSLWAMSGLQKYVRHSRELARRHLVSGA
jgi:hypothetical protein